MIPRLMGAVLRTLVVIDGSSAARARALLRISPATFKRYLVILRDLGCDVRYERLDHAYRVRDPGVFDLAALKRVMR